MNPMTHTIPLNGRTYTWNGKGWIDAKTFTKPPQVVILELNRLLSGRLSQEDDAIEDPTLILERARMARDSGQWARAQALVTRMLALRPGDPGSLAILCSALRAQGTPELAIEKTDPFKGSSYPPLLTSRAAALCDLGQWEGAKKVIGRVLAQPGQHAEAWAVVNRIKSASPNLYG